MKVEKSQGRPRGSKNAYRTPHSSGRKPTNVPDFMRELIKMGKPQSDMPIASNEDCEFGTCRNTARHILIFHTTRMKLCERHHKEWKRRRDEIELAEFRK